MKAPLTRRRRAISDAVPGSLKKITTASAPPAQAIVERLQHVLADIDNLPLPTGKLGCQFLDALELLDKIREKVRQKARELLLKEPGIIPHWHVSETVQRTLSKNTLQVFIAAAHADNGLTGEEFITACTTSLGALRKLLAERNPHWSADEIERTLNGVLAELISYDTVTRLSRSKDKQIELSL
jgi:hypothetical protein